jgi:hypothetical protein
MLPRRLTWDIAQDRWASQLDPVIASAPNNSNILKNVVLAIGSNVINHKLGRVLQGWQLVRIRAAATIYDNQDSNQTPDLTLILVSNAVVTIDLEVF